METIALLRAIETSKAVAWVVAPEQQWISLQSPSRSESLKRRMIAELAAVMSEMGQDQSKPPAGRQAVFVLNIGIVAGEDDFTPSRKTARCRGRRLRSTFCYAYIPRSLMVCATRLIASM
jgi:hypothetical protein